MYLLKSPAIVTALVFTRTKHGADKVVKILHKAGITAAAIHGNKSQNARQHALTNFKGGNIRVLVATDIAARGIDIDDLTHVFNYDLPDVPETYVHRIGRTGRAGNAGVAIAFCDENEKEELRAIQKLINKVIPVAENHPFPAGTAPVPAPSTQEQRRPQKRANNSQPAGRPPRRNFRDRNDRRDRRG